MATPSSRFPVIAAMGLSLALCASGCGEPTPEFVYVRTDSVTVVVSVRAEGHVAVNTWLPLRATRATSGEWRKVPFTEISPDTPWIGYVPPPKEDEVAANLRWFVEPVDGAEFDASAPKPVPIQQRAVRFSKPGVYRLWAESHPPIAARSNTLQVEVVP
jgi:hypothetical protein